jgi:hypothetical protein
MFDEEEEELEDHDMTIKLVAAEFLVTLCVHQDQALPSVYQFILGVLEGTIASEYPRYILFEVMAIVVEGLNLRSDFGLRIIKVLAASSRETLPFGEMARPALIDFGFYMLLTSAVVKELPLLPPELEMALMRQAVETIHSDKPALVYLAFHLVEAISSHSKRDDLISKVFIFY